MKFLKRIQSWSLPTKIGLALGLLGLVFGGSFFIEFSDFTVDNRNSINSPILIQSPSSIINYLEGKDSLLRGYYHISQLYPEGSNIRVGSGFTNNNELLKGTYRKENGQLIFLCDEASKEIYKSVIEAEPKFPFSYYALAVCYRVDGQEVWKSYATKAIDIFNLTTQIEGHRQEHDQALKNLQTHLEGV